MTSDFFWHAENAVNGFNAAGISTIAGPVAPAGPNGQVVAFCPR